jgi:hypothetical protein
MENYINESCWKYPFSSLLMQLRQEVRTKLGEIRKPVPLKIGVNLLVVLSIILDFNCPIVLNGKVES